MSRYLGLALGLALGSTVLLAANKDGRLENCGIVMQEILLEYGEDGPRAARTRIAAEEFLRRVKTGAI